MSRAWSDVRQGLRALRRGRGVTVLVILAFALGIGITTAVFSVFYGVLLKPLPYPNPDELVVVYDTQPACTTCPASYPKYVDWTVRNHVFQAMTGSWTPFAIVTGGGDPERVVSARTTWTFPGVFKVAPSQGRWFTEQEDRPGGAKVVLLSDGYWQRRFAGDAHVIGRTLTIDGDAWQIIGIMPRGFSHRRADLFMPLQRVLDPAQRGNHFLATYARLKPGVTLGQAQQDMRALGSVLAREFGNNHGIDVESYYLAVIGDIAKPLTVLMGAVCLVLIIACANVANLLLAAGVARRRELAVRAALGATRWDLARQMIVESVVLAACGGVLAVGLASWALSTFVELAGTTLPRAATLHIDTTALVFAAGLSILTGIVCGLWPVLRLGRRTLASAVREGDLRTGTDASGRRFGNGLVVVEIALAFSLLVGAGLLVKNLLKLEDRDSGFSTDRIVAFDVAPTGTRYVENNQVQDFYRELVPKLSALPGVASVGVTSHLPMYQFGWNGEVTIEGGSPWQPKDAPLVEFRWIGGDYFKTLRIELVRGRMFDEHDRDGTAPVCVLSKRAADKFWPGQNPIGKWVSKGNNTKREVIGVARDVRTFGLQSGSAYEMYVPIEQESFGAMTVVMRTEGSDPTAIIPSARQVLAGIDPLMPMSKVQTMNAVVGASVSEPRLISSLTALFGVLAGVLAAVGVYGVMAYNVRRQRREFGIRLALGADPKTVRRLVVVRGLVLGAMGVAIGAGGALLLTRTLQSLLSDVKPTDPLVFAATGGALLLVSLAAVYLPARQASRTNPMIALRLE